MFINYVFIIYADGVTTTFIGNDDPVAAIASFEENCQKLNANWGYIFKSEGGEILLSYQLPQQ